MTPDRDRATCPPRPRVAGGFFICTRLVVYKRIGCGAGRHYLFSFPGVVATRWTLRVARNSSSGRGLGHGPAPAPPLGSQPHISPALGFFPDLQTGQTSGQNRLGSRLLLHDTSHMARTIIHVNQHVIRRNTKTGERNPVLSVKRGRTNTYTSSVSIHGPSRVVYSPDCPLNCGARVWIETESQVDINDTPEASCLLQHPTGQPPSGQVPRRNAARQRLGDEGTGIE